MIALPITGKATTPMMRRVVMFRYRLASQPVLMIVDMAITDAGRDTRVVCKEVKPKDFKARFPNDPVPPFGI